ncbi:hypothetical protein [Agromyces sp. Soil535]|uniref:hypothetical protein n=1 Tax=Agromyces sp. Soil535 TaxID=1736390 RepID=UPI000A6A7758|nr:hypothetical protein [Agromyces sp. Soil535]
MRITAGASARVLHRMRSRTLPARCARGRRTCIPGVLVLDLIYVAAIIAVFVVVGIIAKGVEKL